MKLTSPELKKKKKKPIGKGTEATAVSEIQNFEKSVIDVWYELVSFRFNRVFEEIVLSPSKSFTLL